MSPRRESLWARKRTAWHKDAARTRLRERVGWLLPTLLALAAVFLAVGLSRLGDPLGWASLAAALFCLLTLGGLRSGRDWARLTAGSFSAILAVAMLVRMIVARVNGDEWEAAQWTECCAIALMVGLSAVSLLGREGRETFAGAREKIEAKDES